MTNIGLCDILNIENDSINDLTYYGGNRMSFRKSFCLMLAVMFIATGCAAGETVSGNVTAAGENSEAAETETERAYADIPEADYEGYEFTFLHFTASFVYGGEVVDAVAESENGDTINDEVYKRNFAVAEKYNVSFALETAQHDKLNALVIKAANAGDDVYDLVFCRLYETPALISGKYLRDLHTVEYINFSNPWWDGNSVTDMSIGGKLYMAATDMMTGDKDAVYCVLFNKTLAGEYNLPDLYANVREGGWTMEKMLSLVSNATVDLNGDGKLDKKDQWGILGRYDATAALFRGAGCLIAEKNDRDIPEITFESEYNYSVIDEIFNVIYSEDYFDLHVRGISEEEFSSMFANGQGLFAFTTMMAVSQLRAMDTDFGVLPNPKYQETQDGYHNLVSVHWAGLLSIPVTASDTERTGIITEALSAEAEYGLQPAYMEINLKGKSARDDSSEEMIDLIFNTRVYDIGDIFNFADFSYQFLCISGTKSRDIASFYAKYGDKAQTALDELLTAIS